MRSDGDLTLRMAGVIQSYGNQKCDLPAWLNIWREEYELWGARPEGPVMRYGPVADATELVLQVRTRDSAKNMFFPATETMFSFRHDEQGLELNQQLPELKARLLVGLPSCDLQALLVMDNVFGGGGHADPYYSGRRQYTVVVGVACEPGEFCFCQDFGWTDTPPERIVLDDVKLASAGFFRSRGQTAASG